MFGSDRRWLAWIGYGSFRRIRVWDGKEGMYLVVWVRIWFLKGFFEVEGVSNIKGVESDFNGFWSFFSFFFYSGGNYFFGVVFLEGFGR